MSPDSFSSTDLAWRRALICDAASCVEVAPAHGMIAMRNSADPDGPILQYTADEWIIFLKGAKKGDFDDLV